MQAAGGDTEIEYAAVDDRSLIASLFHDEGVFDVVFGSLKVSQRGAGANFSVDVAAGTAFIFGDDVAGQGMYLVGSDAVINVTVPSPPASGTRIHRVVAQVKDKLHNSSDWSVYDWEPVLLEDTGSGTPALPDSAITLATVSVANGQVSVTDSNITDTRTQACLITSKYSLAFADADRPPNPYESELIWRTNTKDYEVWDGSEWRPFGINPPAARLGRITTNQSIADSTTTALQWNSELEDTHGGHDNTTNPSRYTAPVAGLYAVTVSAPWAQATLGARQLDLRVNGSTIYPGARDGSPGNITFVQNASRKLRLAAGDYVEAVVWQSSGSSVAIDRTFHSGPGMEVCWLRP
jgi:hypothetical protein